MTRWILSTPCILLVVVFVFSGSALAASCGGFERWPVKVASDPEANQIDARRVRDVSVTALNKIEPSEVIATNNEFDRMEIEKQVFRVHGFLAMYKLEPDGDYHLAITDETAQVTKAGAKTRPTGHSFVAEIPGTACFAGKDQQFPRRSRFASEIGRVRKAFETGVAKIDARKIGPRTIPVTITGVLFFDFDHGQVGRSVVHRDAKGKRLVIELHPLLAIKFGPKQSQ
jgi:hypothetical protein